MTHLKKQTEHFAGIEDLPINRWQDLNLALLIEAGAGGGIEGLESTLSTAYRHLLNKEPEKASIMLANCLQNIAFAKEKIVPVSIAWAATVRTIDGADVSHLSAEQVVEKLGASQFIYSSLKNYVEDFRKKCVGELEAFFPQFAKSPKEVEHAAFLKKRTSLLLQSILQNVETANEVAAIDRQLLSLHRPVLLGGKDGAEVKGKKEFDTLCLTLQTSGIDRPEHLSVRKFYAAIELLSKKA